MNDLHIKVGYELESPRPMHMRVSNLQVSVIPLDHEEASHFTIDVAWRGKDRWAVLWLGRCLSREGEWGYEPSPSNREDDWLDNHRFTREEAIALAAKHAPLLKINGWLATKVADEIKEEEAQAAREATQVGG